jgi:hypothetical protein
VESGKCNVYIGLVAMIVAAVIGFALGKSLEPYFANGYAQIPFWRFLTRVGHTHGMLMGLVNVVTGLLLGRLDCSPGIRRAASILSALAILLPVGVCLRGITEGAMIGEVLAMLGGFSLVGACALLLVGLAGSKWEGRGIG